MRTHGAGGSMHTFALERRTPRTGTFILYYFAEICEVAKTVHSGARVNLNSTSRSYWLDNRIHTSSLFCALPSPPL